MALALICAMGFLSKAQAKVRPKLILAAMVPSESLIRHRLQALYTYIFDKADCDVELRFVPSARALLEAQNGGVDGDFFRIAEYGHYVPHMVRVKEPVAYACTSLYYMNDRLKRITSLDALVDWEGQPLSVGYTRGVIGQEELVKQSDLVQHHQVHAITDPNQGLNMLLEGRIDVLLGTPVVINVKLQRRKLTDSVKTSAILSKRKGYIWLHKRYLPLVPRLEAVVRQARKDGMFERLIGKSITLIPAQ